jgi:hypothetical protein
MWRHDTYSGWIVLCPLQGLKSLQGLRLVPKGSQGNVRISSTTRVYISGQGDAFCLALATVGAVFLLVRLRTLTLSCLLVLFVNLHQPTEQAHYTSRLWIMLL